MTIFRISSILTITVAMAAGLALSGCGFYGPFGLRAVKAAAAQPAKSGLEAVLAQMDASSKNFRSAQASVKREQYERLVHDTATQTGSMYFQRTGSAIQMGAKFDPPRAEVLDYKNGTLRVYSPDNNHLETKTASGADQARFQTYLTLGFGGSGSDLAKTWNITDQGPETIEGAKVEKLDLVSKDPSVKANYSHITIWIDPARDITLKQEFFDPAGNTNTVTYSNVRYNQSIQNMGAYAIKCKGKCE
jgi:outer membrane lipoprotein-sorting protein